MSISTTVYLQQGRMLTPQQWNAAILAAGFPMEMDEDFDVEAFSGFLPCRLYGQRDGFEYAFSTEPPDASLDIGDRDVAVAFVTHASMVGLATAVIAASVLCAQTDGILHDEESGELVAANDALDNARALIASMGDDIHKS